LRVGGKNKLNENPTGKSIWKST